MRDTGKKIVDFIESQLNANDITVAEMCREIGMRKEVISMWKAHSTTIPRLDTLIKIADYFHITVSQLIGEKDIEYQKEVLPIVNMLNDLSQQSLSAIFAVVKTYYDLERGEKNPTGEVAW